jgi:hypothetical protein
MSATPSVTVILSSRAECESRGDGVQRSQQQLQELNETEDQRDERTTKTWWWSFQYSLTKWVTTPYSDKYSQPTQPAWLGRASVVIITANRSSPPPNSDLASADSPSTTTHNERNHLEPQGPQPAGRYWRRGT